MRSNAGPLDNVVVRFGQGVTAFYGQNGAGKTWILNSLRHALRGREWGFTQLICEFETGSAGSKWIMDHLAKSARENRYHATPESDRVLLRNAITNWFHTGGRFFKPYETEDEMPRELADELARVETFVLVPSGGAEPEWDVWLCLPTNLSNSPACLHALERLTNLWKESDELEERITLSVDAAFDACEKGEISQEELAAVEEEAERQYEEQNLLQVSYIFEPLAGLAWEYRHIALPDHVRRLLEPLLSDGLPFPVVKLFTARDIPLVLEDDEDETDINSLTAQSFAARFREDLDAAKDTLVVSESMRKWIRNLNSEANKVYSSLLQDAPALTLDLRPPGQWVTEGAVHWHVEHGNLHFPVKVPVVSLSRAESRWARIAVRRAVNYSTSTSALIIDEPEAALHRAAERHMSRGLDGLATFGPQVVVATHSPEVLNAPATHNIHVSKHDGRTGIGEMPILGTETLAVLGLSPSDLLGLYRIFLLVEGEHDQIVIRTLCGEFLDAARVKIIPMRGGRKLPGTIESHVLFDLSDAHVVAVLDDVRAEEICDAWLDAQTRYLAGNPDEAIRFLAQKFGDRRGKEYEWITNWLGRALRKGVRSRMHPYGLAARDVIEYLPVEVLVPLAKKPWEELRREHDAAALQLDKSKGLHDFKAWLKHVYKADLSLDNIRRGAESVDEVPEDLRSLAYRLREISHRPPASDAKL